MADSPSSKPEYREGASSVPRTPQPPFSPPKRFSSLAFASSPYAATPTSPWLQRDDADSSRLVETPQHSQLDVNIKRRFASPLARDSPSQLQRVLQVARGALHRDMFAASSPASSIESRMNLENTISWQPNSGVGADTKEWRYSTAPQSLAAASVDVREPLRSPTLPDVLTIESGSIDEIIEPVSSGFASPSTGQLDQEPSEFIAADFPPVDVISYRSSGDCHASDNILTPGSVGEAEVNQDLARLQFHSDHSNSTGSQDSPKDSHFKSHSVRGSEGRSMQVSPVNSIYLSESAEAAAESAKAKRRWLKGIFPEDKDDEDDDDDGADEQEVDMGDQLPNLQVMCPDPLLHQMVRTTPCPEPSLHSQSPSLYRRPVEYYESDVVFSDQEDYQIMPTVPVYGSHRATATGSPMPFQKLKLRPPTAYSGHQSSRSPTPLSTRAQVAAVTEHFQPGWYYAREPVRPSSGPSYSFSTAASKAIGSDQAPDSRMRDSYKTDTLTALPVPTTRYRKNGIGARVMPRGVGRYYERPPSAASARVGSFRPRPSSRQTYVSSSEVRFRSSPPRELGEDRLAPTRRKRAMDDSFIIAEDTYRSASVTPDMHTAGGESMMQRDKRIDMAVRTSIFGGSTPEALRSARHGIKELSPNVQLYRKGAQENIHLRKKRRPSYWDNDLKEVRESPAGRGGVRSPVSAQESVRAEFEEASLRDTEMGYDEVEVTGNAADS